jgi:hypothetical protein
VAGPVDVAGKENQGMMNFCWFVSVRVDYKTITLHYSQGHGNSHTCAHTYDVIAIHSNTVPACKILPYCAPVDTLKSGLAPHNNRNLREMMDTNQQKQQQAAGHKP